MTKRWHALSPPQRRIVHAGIVVLVMLTAWAFAWMPLAESRTALRAEAVEQAATLAWMRSASAQLRALGVTHAPVTAPEGSILSRVDQSARAAGLGASIVSVEPADAHRVRIQLSGADFDVVIAWLERSGSSGLQVEEISIQRASGPGRIDGRVGFRDGTP